MHQVYYYLNTPIHETSLANLFNIQSSSGIPIYRQVVEQVKRLIVSGQLEAGEQLPSVRQLAVDLAVNAMTISKAYSQLEQEGLVERRRGIGMIIKNQTEKPNKLLEPALDELIRQATDLNLSKAQVIRELQKRWDKK